MSQCPAKDCLNGCGGIRTDCPMRDWIPTAAVPGIPDKSTYTREVADVICARLAKGDSLRAICAHFSMPPRTTVHKWAVQNIDGFGDRFTRARIFGYEEMADQTIEIADDGRNDITETDGRVITNQDVIARSRLRVETRKWMLAKMLPKVYGDKSEVALTGPNGGPIVSATIATDDPAEAARAYQRLINGEGG